MKTLCVFDNDSIKKVISDNGLGEFASYISFFCEVYEWEGVINQCIRPLFTVLLDEKYVEYCQVELSFGSKEYIKLTLNYNADQNVRLLHYLKHFFDVKMNNRFNLSFTSSIDTLSAGILKKSISVSSEVRELDCSILKQELSAIILVGLSDDEISKGLVIWFAFFLHIIFFMVMSNDDQKNARKELIKFYSIYEQIAEIDYEAHFEANRSVLEDTVKELSQRVHLIVSEDWIGRWICLCIRERDASEFHGLSYYKLLYQLHKLLGINRSMNSILFFFMKKIIMQNVI